MAASQTRYTYDAKGRLTKVESDGGGAVTTNYTYDAADNRSTVKITSVPHIINGSFENPILPSDVYRLAAPYLGFAGASGISRTAHQIMAVLGVGLKEAMIYKAAADQKRLAAQGMSTLTVSQMANQAASVSQSPAKSLKEGH